MSDNVTPISSDVFVQTKLDLFKRTDELYDEILAKIDEAELLVPIVLGLLQIIAREYE